MESILADKLRNGAAQLGLTLGDKEVKLYLKYLESLIIWNEKFNLTAIREPDEILVKHFLDSMAVLPYIKEKFNLRLLDVGTGAGFPGIPVKIVRPEIDVVLLDSLNKRINFLNHLISELQLKQITCIHGRAEDYGRQEEYREAFDLVTSRAVARLSVLAELCLPFVKVGGVFIAYKGPKSREEIEEARGALNILGGELTRHVEVKLPGIEEVRSLLFISKERPTSDKYPRKAGLPEKKPLS